MDLWPHQQRALDGVSDALGRSVRRVCVASPTGSGKGVVIERLVEGAESAILYTDRRTLLDQTAERLTAAGFHYGVRASGHTPRVLPPIQLAMVQTEDSRVIKTSERKHHRCELVVLDEAHRRGDVLDELVSRHMKDGATVVGLTATPCGLAEHYDELIFAASVRECIEAGALVPAHTYAPSEIDTRDLKTMGNGDYEPGEMSRRVCRPSVFGNVLEHFVRLNPEHRPALLFGPDVAGAKWFCEQFNAAGVPAGHVDGEHVVIRDEVMPASTETREQLREALRSGEIRVVTNRYVLREGVDWPFVEVGIFATSFGSLTTYIQSGGRMLRASAGKRFATIIDHGGNYHRHGSLNADRDWSLDVDDREMVASRIERMRNQRVKDAEESEREPIVCPECGKVREKGPDCPACGFSFAGKSRTVIQTDGTLKEVRGDIYRPRRVCEDPAEVKAWKSCYFRCKNSKRKMTFSQASALFAKEHQGRHPDPAWPFMPKRPSDRSRHIKDVPTQDLCGELAEAVA